ncbi:MAG TPA: VIT1/CCC1 family protein [Tepidiformaceae bacterium]
MTDQANRETASSESDIQRFRRNYQDEVDGAELYRLLAAAESDPHLKDLYERLGKTELRHLALWEEKLREAGADVPKYRPSFRTRFIGFLARRFGTRAVSPIVSMMESNATGMYDSQPEAVEANLPADERQHARVFRELSKDTEPVTGADIARAEGRHGNASGNAVRASVLGVNDGLVSTLSLVMGVAGADPGRTVVLLSGIAGLFAGSFAMALGEWISVRSSVEMYERQVNIEREELLANPEEEEEELSLIYQAKGLSEADARATARRIVASPQTALDTLVREELGMSAEESGNPWVAAGSSFAMFSVGAILPVLPWFFIGGIGGVSLSAAAAGLGLFSSGAITTLFTGRNVIFSGARMLAFGLSAAALTFAIGRVIGASAGI